MSESRTEERAMLKAWEELKGRERDAMIAEHVMGYVWAYSPVELPCYRFLTNILHEPWELWRENQKAIKPEPLNSRIRVPHYSTDVSADYSVLEKVRSEWGLKASSDKGWAFQSKLAEIYQSRLPRNFADYLLMPCLYEPGDYSQAAYSVVREEAGE